MRFPSEYEQNLHKLGNIIESKVQFGWSPWQEQWESSKFAFILNFISKTNNLNDTTNIKLYPGIGLGIKASVPLFNEKRPKEEFGRSTGIYHSYIAYDPFWEVYNTGWRMVNEFRIDVFKIANKTITFSLNGKIDGPIGFKGPSDIRFSLSAATNVSTISNFIGGN
jgi:hypothetical protein